jgi:very-short-patch-repair endonuclease
MDAPKRTVERARALRAAMSLPEVLLWEWLRKRGLGGRRFRRQHPFGPYILDFYCAALKVGIEIDGAGHDHPDAVLHDQRRDAWIERRGVRLIRIPARWVLDDDVGLFEWLDAELTAIDAGRKGR